MSRDRRDVAQAAKANIVAAVKRDPELTMPQLKERFRKCDSFIRKALASEGLAPALGVTTSDAARAQGLTKKFIHRIVKERKPTT